ncbi:MAG: hypothetical protein KDD22_08450, partial [Bdellovibrionales bacterium]|nr:hypothetical protein [Bdellovibrionales bacterium]
EAVGIGELGRPIPQGPISTYNGNLNLKPGLNLEDGVDFWESLEGMRIKFKNPRILGFRGGLAELNENKPKSYLTLYAIADGKKSHPRNTPQGGLLADDQKRLFNPQIFQIITNHLTKGFNADTPYRVGDLIETGDKGITGVLTYEKNLFGGGEFAVVLPGEPSEAESENKDVRDPFKTPIPSNIWPLGVQSQQYQDYLKWLKLPDEKKIGCEMTEEEALSKSDKIENSLGGEIHQGLCYLSQRPRTRLEAGEDQLSVATFNVENLPGHEDDRLMKIAAAVVMNLKCPDVINFVEIQDNNGVDFNDSSSASTTLDKIIYFMKIYSKQMEPTGLNCSEKNYKSLNINPLQNAEGGEPGGNIRVAMVYNASKLKFEKRGQAGPLNETVVLTNGDIFPNPGRISPNNDAFHHSRRSLVAQFEFKGERFFLIGNHWASKLGDNDIWGATQPAALDSDNHRIPMGREINEFVQLLKVGDPLSNVAVVGDFNAFMNERSIKALEGHHLQNLYTYRDLMAPEARYTYNHNGNSQAIDFVFADSHLLQKSPQVEVIHLNTDYMGRLSDHDPVVALFQF